MRRLFVPVFFGVLMAAAVLPSSMPPLSAAAPAAPTFNKDVLPILQQNCQECHRPGAIAPMSLMTYKDARPYARAIARVTASKTMPPWFADPAVGRSEERRVGKE